MDVDGVKEEIKYCQDLVKVHRKALHYLELQQANFGLQTPPHILIEIDSKREIIQKLEEKISKLQNILKNDVNISPLSQLDQENIGKDKPGEQTEKSSTTEYRRSHSILTEDLRRLQEYAITLELEEVVDKAAKLLERVKADRFNITVIGDFKCGKSSLINALLGQEVLPVDILPFRSVLTRVTYGAKPLARLIFKNGRDKEIALDQLIDHIIKLTSKADKSAEIDEVIVYFPSKYLRHNVDILDTPGSNDDKVITQVTLDVLTRTDIAIIVLNAVSPFSNMEVDFLNNTLLMSDIGRVIFVVNRLDLIRRDEDRNQLLDAIRRRISSIVQKQADDLFGSQTEEYEFTLRRMGYFRVFGISSLEALEAKIDEGRELLEKSGFLMFETVLEQFLAHERGSVILQSLSYTIFGIAEQILRRISILEVSQELYQYEIQDLLSEIANDIPHNLVQSLAQNNNIKILEKIRYETHKIQGKALAISGKLHVIRHV